jgi:hypothetical protein
MYAQEAEPVDTSRRTRRQRRMAAWRFLRASWLLGTARLVFTSPLHVSRFPWPVEGEQLVIPPPIDLDRFKAPRQSNSHRSGAVAISQWRSPGKGGQLLREWSDREGPVDVYGEGEYVPRGPNLHPKGPVDPDKVAQTLWGYETFVHLPTELEPFGRSVIEAREAGCGVVINGNVGARHYLTTDSREELETAAETFWGLFL